MSDEKEEVRIKRNMVFIGRRTTGDWLWADVDIDDNDGRHLDLKEARMRAYGSKKNIKSVIPGTIIGIEGTESGTVYLGTIKIAGAWKNEEQVANWWIEHNAAESEIATVTKSIRELKQRLPLNKLEPFQRAYRNARTKAQRAHILAMVIQKVTELGS